MITAAQQLGYSPETQDAIGCAYAAVKVGTAPAVCGGTPSLPVAVLMNGVPVTGISDSTAGNMKFWSLQVPSGQSTLTLTISGGTGDADMYVQFGSMPSMTVYQCRPYLSGNNETCTFTNPAAGTWYVDLTTYTPYSGVTLIGSYYSDRGCSPELLANAGPDRTICLGQAVTLGTPMEPGNTYSWLPGGATTVEFTVTPGSDTVYTVNATTQCDSSSDSAIVRVISGPVDLFDNFDTCPTGWTTTGLWHRVTASTCASPGYSSATRAFYYGQDGTCNYNTGAPNTGTLTSLSPPYSVSTTSSMLSFNYFRLVESYNGAGDRTDVDVGRSDGTAIRVFSRNASHPSSTAWTSSGNLSLAEFAGDTIRVRFTFNTGDRMSNSFTGWLIDDVKVTNVDICGICQAPNQCQAPIQPLLGPCTEQIAQLSNLLSATRSHLGHGPRLCIRASWHSRCIDGRADSTIGQEGG